MRHLLVWFSQGSPWIWTASSVTGFLISARAWLLARAYRRARTIPGPLVPYVERTALMRMMRLLGFTAVGLIFISTWFVYPQTRPHYFATLPLLLLVSSFSTLAILLAAPITDAVMAYWTLKFLLDDPIPTRKK